MKKENIKFKSKKQEEIFDREEPRDKDYFDDWYDEWEEIEELMDEDLYR